MLSALDNLLLHFDGALRACAGSVGRTTRARPAAHKTSGANMAHLSPPQRKCSARLMRVNHCGEVCAQALYHGQALTAKSGPVAESMRLAALEEADHLSWCESRIKELGGNVSYLNPLWYTASFLMGAMTGLLGDRINLGFVAATEHGVCEHLERHLQKLPANDRISSAILTKMREDEEKHMHTALDAGGAKFPPPVGNVMQAVSKLMTQTTHWV